MKKVVCLCSSRNVDGETILAINAIKNELLELDPMVEFAILTPYDYILNFSENPPEAFYEGSDRLEREELDDTHKLKVLLEAADLVILATPTYYGNVSADMKLFIDRFCHLAHLFYFAPKPCVLLVTSDGSGHTQVANHLRAFSNGLGMVSVKEVICGKTRPLSSLEVSEVARKCLESLNNPDAIEPTSSMELNFQALKARMLLQPEGSAERLFWEQSGMFECGTLKEYFSSKRITQ